METVLSFLPNTIAEAIKRIPPQVRSGIEEIRVRISRPVEITTSGTVHFLSYDCFRRGCITAIEQNQPFFNLYT